MPSRQKIVFGIDCLTGPVRVHPNGITWEAMQDGHEVVLVAPTSFILECKEHLSTIEGYDFDVTLSSKEFDDGLSRALIKCVEASSIEVIPAEQSPTGKGLRMIQRVHLSKRQVQTMRTEGKRHKWPFNRLMPGDAVEVLCPKDFAKHVSSSSRSYVSPAADRRLISKIMPWKDKDHRKVLVWCEEV